MAIIKGTMKQECSVEVDAIELLKGLAREIGVEKVLPSYSEERDTFYKLGHWRDQHNIERPCIERVENHAYHGTTDFGVSSVQRLTEEQYRCAKALCEIEKDVIAIAEKRRNGNYPVITSDQIGILD